MELMRIPGVGISIANDLRELGYQSVEDLRNADADEMFEPTADKIYRHPTFYEIPDDVGHM